VTPRLPPGEGGGICWAPAVLVRPGWILLAASALPLLWSGLAVAEPSAAEAPARFEKGSREWGLSLGQGTGLGIWGSEDRDAGDVRFVGLVPRYGIGLSDPIADGCWLHGNLELLLEGALLAAYGPKGSFLGGANVVFRFNFLSFGRVVPFVELGAGLAYLELDLDSQSDGLGFTPPAGWRLHHVSNAGIGADNDGINESLLLIGVSWFP